MLFNEIVELISVTTSENELGDTIETETVNQVFANKLTYRNKAFYQAMSNGLKPQVTFEVKEIDYQDQVKLRHNGKTYRIVDVAPLKRENVGLICEGLVNNGLA